MCEISWLSELRVSVILVAVESVYPQCEGLSVCVRVCVGNRYRGWLNCNHKCLYFVRSRLNKHIKGLTNQTGRTDFSYTESSIIFWIFFNYGGTGLNERGNAKWDLHLKISKHSLPAALHHFQTFIIEYSFSGFRALQQPQECLHVHSSFTLKSLAAFSRMTFFPQIAFPLQFLHFPFYSSCSPGVRPDL